METKRAWSAPQVRPLTDSGSRADVPDLPVQNGLSGGGN